MTAKKTSDTDNLRTIVLTEHAPIIVDDDLWPVIAQATGKMISNCLIDISMFVRKEVPSDDRIAENDAVVYGTFTLAGGLVHRVGAKMEARDDRRNTVEKLIRSVQTDIMIRCQGLEFAILRRVCHVCDELIANLPPQRI